MDPAGVEPGTNQLWDIGVITCLEAGMYKTADHPLYIGLRSQFIRVMKRYAHMRQVLNISEEVILH